MITISEKTWRTAEDTSPLADYEAVAFTSWKEANEFEAKGASSAGLFLTRSVFPHTPGWDGLLAHKGIVAVGLFAPAAKKKAA